MKKKISTYAKEHDLSYKTVWRMVKNNQIKYEKLPTGTILIIEENNESKDNIKVILYARVSSSENKSNLDNQLERIRNFAIAKGYKIIKEIKEIGSGLNDNRKQLLSILKSDNYDKIIVEHKDRFCRFGIKFIQEMLKKDNKDIEIINNYDNDKEDLMQDFISIITSFCARLYGQRRCKRKTEKIIKDLNNND